LYGRGENAGSAMRQVVLRGADLTGIELKLIKYGSIAGRALVESSNADPPAPRCESQTRSHLEEIRLNARSDPPPQRQQDPLFATEENWRGRRVAVANSKGEFKVQNLVAGLYHLNVNLFGEDWYVRSMTRPSAVGARERTDVARAGLPIKLGEQISGVEV